MGTNIYHSFHYCNIAIYVIYVISNILVAMAIYLVSVRGYDTVIVWEQILVAVAIYLVSVWRHNTMVVWEQILVTQLIAGCCGAQNRNLKETCDLCQ